MAMYITRSATLMCLAQQHHIDDELDNAVPTMTLTDVYRTQDVNATTMSADALPLGASSCSLLHPSHSSHAGNNACSTAAAPPPPALSGELVVSNCTGTLITQYSYAVAIQPKKQLMRRSSYQNCVHMVPDVDDLSSSSCDVSGGYGTYTAGGSSDDDEASSAAPSLVPSSTRASSARPYNSPCGSGGSGAVVPVYDAGDGASSQAVLGDISQHSLFDSVTLALWEDCADQGLFRYDVTACATKLVPGMFGFVAQLNEGRANQKRPTEFRVDQVIQPFDSKKFNFKKAYMKEVLFAFEAGTEGAGSRLAEDAVCTRSCNLVFINVSPIEYGHVLLVPRVLDDLPQLLDASTMLLGLRFALEADNPYFRVGYNSLGAYATINHLHFQAYYLAAPYPCERAPTAPISGLKRRRSNLKIHRLLEYPVQGFVVEVGDSLEEMAAVVGAACVAMQQRNIPHNVLITDSGARVFIWPQCYAEKQAQGLVPEELLDTGVNPAVFEIAGHMVLKRRQDYEGMTQEMAWRMLEQVSVGEARLAEIANVCFNC